jgi:hypothetical protein
MPQVPETNERAGVNVLNACFMSIRSFGQFVLNELKSRDLLP